MRRLTVVGLAVFCGLSVLAAEFHVAPTGGDDSAGTQTRPFATVQRALEEARKANGPHRIAVYPGTYYLTQTLVLGPRDSGLTISGDKKSRWPH